MPSETIDRLVSAVTYLEYQMAFVEAEHPWMFKQYFFRVPRTSHPTAPELQ